MLLQINTIEASLNKLETVLALNSCISYFTNKGKSLINDR